MSTVAPPAGTTGGSALLGSRLPSFVIFQYNIERTQPVLLHPRGTAPACRPILGRESRLTPLKYQVRPDRIHSVGDG